MRCAASSRRRSSPTLEELEHGDTPPYDVLRKMMRTFGLDEVARQRFARRIAREKAAEQARARGEGVAPAPERGDGDGDAGMQLIPIIELCRYCPGMVTAMGVSVGLTADARSCPRGRMRQKERWALDLFTLEKIGAWAITEPGSGSDAFGGMKSTARRDGDGYVLNGNKTFITNGPYADTIVFICKLDEGNDPKERKVLTFVLERGDARPHAVEAAAEDGPALLAHRRALPRRRARRARPPARRDRGRARAHAAPRQTFTMERTGVAAMALGIVEQCRELSLDYARTRVQFGRPIGEFQLIQLKLAKMEVARMNIQNLVFRQIEMSAPGKPMDLAEASACKLYAAQAAMEVALEAVQLFGGNGYMAEFQVEQLCRDAKVLQIYARHRRDPDLADRAQPATGVSAATTRCRSIRSGLDDRDRRC